jgi:hypothetical protein
MKLTARLVVLWLFVLGFVLVAGAQNCLQTSTECKWDPGDIFISGKNASGTASGQWLVFRPGTGFIDSVSDNQGTITSGANFASAIDNTWHLIGTDSGSGSNFSFVTKFRVSPDDTTNPVVSPPLSQVVSDFSAINMGTNSKGATVTSTNPQSIVVDGAGNTLVASANPAVIGKFSPSGTAISSSPFPIVLSKKTIDSQLAGIDTNPHATVLYYTSGGTSIRTVQLTGTGAGTVATFASFSRMQLHGIRYIPHAWLPSTCGSVACPAGDALLVAGGNSILLVSTTGTLVTSYTVQGQSSLQSLALDPMLRSQDYTGMTRPGTLPLQGFWTSSPNSTNFYHVSLSTGAVISTGDVSSEGYTGVYSIATYPGLSASQQPPTKFLNVPPLVAAANTFQTNSDNLTFQTDQFSLTAYANPSFGASGYSTTPDVFASAIQPSAGISDAGYPCLETLGTSANPLCTVWQVDLGSNLLPSNGVLADKILSSSSAPQLQNGDSRLFRNEWDDVTDKIDVAGWGRTSVYSINQVPGAPQSGAGGANCVYYPPVNSGYPNSNTGGSLNKPGNITFRFSCPGLNPTVFATMEPRISIVQLNTGDAPLPYFPVFTSLTGGTCCTQADYRLDTSGGTPTWVINVSFKNLSTPNVTFTATTYDQSNQVSAFDITFSVNNN